MGKTSKTINMKTKLMIAGLSILLGSSLSAQEATTGNPLTPEQQKMARQKDSLANVLTVKKSIGGTKRSR